MRGLSRRPLRWWRNCRPCGGESLSVRRAAVDYSRGMLITEGKINMAERMVRPPFDEKSYELADSFLTDEDCRNLHHRRALAQQIQETIQRYLDTHED